jgi:hypothetical protein
MAASKYLLVSLTYPRICCCGKRHISWWSALLDVVDFKVKANVRSRHLSVSSILYFKFISIDEMQIITESRFFHWQNVIYIAEAGIKVWTNFISLFLRSPWRYKTVSNISISVIQQLLIIPRKKKTNHIWYGQCITDKTR